MPVSLEGVISTPSNSTSSFFFRKKDEVSRKKTKFFPPTIYNVRSA
jgi:hypothetical protein